MNHPMDGKELKLFWEQPKASQRKFVLCSGKEIVAALDFNSAFSTLADGIMGGEHWTFKRVGFLSSRVTVRKTGTKDELAIYHPNWSGSQGKVQFSNGEIYNWGEVNFWGTRFIISRADGLELISFQSGSRDKKLSNIFKQQAEVVIASEAWQIKELPILVLLGWYLVILQSEDSAAVAVTASIGILN